MKVTIIPKPIAQTPTVRIPPSKSMAHRAILCASLAQGVSHIDNIDYSDDILATIDGMEQLGAKITRKADSLTITGIQDLHALQSDTIDCNESGSTLRFFIPIFSLSGKPVSFTGRNRLLKRPQGIYETLFRERGLRFEQQDDRILVEGRLPAGRYELDGNVSSQFITGLLFALPLLQGDSTIVVRPPFASRSYILLTLEVLAQFGVKAFFTDEYTLQIPGNQQYQPRDYTVEGDFSQLAFFAVLGAAGRDVRCIGMRHDSRQGDRAILDFIRDAGGRVEEIPGGYAIEKRPLTGHRISIGDCPDLGPILTVLAMYAEGTTVLCDAARLRYKESDRIAAMEEELRKLGVSIRSTQDEMIIDGGKLYHGSETLFGHKDHRIVMSLSIAAMCGGFPVTIDGAECIQKSYPGFFRDLEQLGCEVEVLEP
ncbi:MAG: 3-phosphoshikimate 1-carboxyvinyltransferase [Oscillospiraceae bacterium]|nr:3-phosphoshikimate 1-carboxyvinyltransferase [Oscillospiraceae bacterium]